MAKASKSSKKVVDIKDVLEERGKLYGAFAFNSKTSQELKDVMRNSQGWQALANDQREALEMAAHKIGRILNGNPDYVDSWVDIAGYTQLVADRLTEDAEA